MGGKMFCTGNQAQARRDPKEDRNEAIKYNDRGDIQFNNNNF